MSLCNGYSSLKYVYSAFNDIILKAEARAGS